MKDTGYLFCDAFIDAVFGDQPADPAVVQAMAQPGFAVYRNTIMKACIDALAANFPAVHRLTGSAWFHDVARLYVRKSPPVSASLLDYGDSFPDFLERIDRAGSLPYLGGVARLERMWIESHTAADQPVLESGALSGIDPAHLGATVLRMHASARWTWCATMPLVSIWHANRMPDGPVPQPPWRGEGVLLTRRHGAVEQLAIGPGAAAFLHACAAGAQLQDAAGMALAAEPGLDLARMLSELLCAGAFRAPDPND